MSKNSNIVTINECIGKLDHNIVKARHDIKWAKLWLTRNHLESYRNVAFNYLDHANGALENAIEAMKKIKR